MLLKQRASVPCRASVSRVLSQNPRASGAQRFSASRNFASSAVHQKQRLLIVGSGWGGYGILRGVDKKRWDVTIVSPTNYFNFTPLLASCAVGTLEFRCAVEPVRRYTPQVVAFQAWVDRINFEQKTVQCMPATPAPFAMDSGDGTTAPIKPGMPFNLRWDKMILAAGAYSQTFGVPGVKEHAHFLKDVKDARAIRMRILECFEQAMQPTLSDVDRRKLLNFCIVGGGPTGVEFASELHDLLHAEVADHYPSLVKMAKITIYDVAPNILGSFDKTLVEYAEKSFSREGISILTSHHVERVEAGRMFVKERGEGNVLTDEHLNLIQTDGSVNPDVWGIGDCAQIEDAVLPATAQVANQKAQYMVKKLNKLAKNQDSPAPFKFANQGSLAYIGDWKAIYDNSGDNLKDDKILSKESGRLAWLLWRSAYFTQSLSLRNKILVPMYWSVTCPPAIRVAEFREHTGSSTVGRSMVEWTVLTTLVLGIFGRDITRF
ncbi:NDE1, mitochondrial external NADH dehydrogenase [Mycena alexandri]|uniref:NDE1, mitochondrial external NADH dehydrogenase n=1 Tax=Mycena alexandri TaxID=1745969 RepID=A0AAD6SQ35_9AGAR|nr:NDE1, mitochondrial external NADH dehydrogenase [Mycena alexandri]